jgi:hypothetical protein
MPPRVSDAWRYGVFSIETDVHRTLHSWITFIELFPDRFVGVLGPQVIHQVNVRTALEVVAIWAQVAVVKIEKLPVAMFWVKKKVPYEVTTVMKKLMEFLHCFVFFFFGWTNAEIRDIGTIF